MPYCCLVDGGGPRCGAQAAWTRPFSGSHSLSAWLRRIGIHDPGTRIASSPRRRTMPRVSFNSVNSDHAVGSDAKIQELGTRWGISPGYWLWGPPVRILIVVDGRINIGKDPFQFGLGYVLETLRDPA